MKHMAFVAIYLLQYFFQIAYCLRYFFRRSVYVCVIIYVNDRFADLICLHYHYPHLHVIDIWNEDFVLYQGVDYMYAIYLRKSRTDTINNIRADAEATLETHEKTLTALAKQLNRPLEPFTVR